MFEYDEHGLEPTVSDEEVESEQEVEVEVEEQSATTDSIKQMVQLSQTLSEVEKRQMNVMINRYVDLKKEISVLVGKASKLRFESLQFEAYIDDFMTKEHKSQYTSNGVTILRKIGENKPKTASSEHAQGIIAEFFMEKFGSPEYAEQLTTKIYDSLPTKETVKIEMEKIKSPKNK